MQALPPPPPQDEHGTCANHGRPLLQLGYKIVLTSALLACLRLARHMHTLLRYIITLQCLGTYMASRRHTQHTPHTMQARLALRDASTCDDLPAASMHKACTLLRRGYQPAVVAHPVTRPTCTYLGQPPCHTTQPQTGATNNWAPSLHSTINVHGGGPPLGRTATRQLGPRHTESREPPERQTFSSSGCGNKVGPPSHGRYPACALPAAPFKQVTVFHSTEETGSRLPLQHPGVQVLHPAACSGGCCAAGTAGPHQAPLFSHNTCAPQGQSLRMRRIN